MQNWILHDFHMLKTVIPDRRLNLRSSVKMCRTFFLVQRENKMADKIENSQVLTTVLFWRGGVQTFQLDFRISHHSAESPPTFDFFSFSNDCRDQGSQVHSYNAYDFSHVQMTMHGDQQPWPLYLYIKCLYITQLVSIILFLSGVSGLAVGYAFASFKGRSVYTHSLSFGGNFFVMSATFLSKCK